MKKILSILVIITMTLSLCTYAQSDNVSEETAIYIYNMVKNPTVSSVGGEWTIIGLSRSGAVIPEEYYARYYQNTVNYVEKCGGILHERKYTEYSRVILALTAIGETPEKVGSYNLLLPLGDFEKTVWQGVNGAAWALIALDSGNYSIPQNPQAKVQATREMYISHLLKKQKEDGGWALSENAAESDVDITGMVIQALAKYKDRKDVSEAIEKALSWISAKQDHKGGFSSYGTENCESSVQIIVGLCALGISYKDERFIKNNNTILDYIMSYKTQDGGFKHSPDDKNSNLMATEQVFYALCAIDRMENSKTFIYDMSDVSEKNYETEEKKEETLILKTFEDIKEHKNREAVEALASKGIISGKSDNLFDPESTMTRAEFATIIVKALNLTAKEDCTFSDVDSKDWFCPYVSAAYENGIINGVGENLFNPHGTITRQEAAVMLERSAKLMDKENFLNTMASRDILAVYIDYVKTAPWALNSLAFCVNEGIIEEEGMEIIPLWQVKRGEVAQMVYNLVEGRKTV